MKTTKYISLIIFITSWLSSFSQEVISIQQCRELAIQQDESLQIANKQLDKAQEQKAAARALYLPNFSATATGLYQNKNFNMELTVPTQKPNPLTGMLEPNIMTDPSGKPILGADGNPIFNMYAWLPLNINMSGAYLAGISLEQPLYTGGKINAGNKMANIGIKMASENISLQQMNTIVEADRAYWSFISVNQKVQLAQQAVDMLKEIVKKVKNSHDVGMVSKNDLLKAQVELNNALLDLQKANNGLELSRMNLCRVTGFPLNTALTPVDTVITLNTPNAILEKYSDIENRPEYKILQKNIELQEQNIRITRSNYLPSAGVQAGYNRIGGIEVSGTDFSNNSLNVIASVKIPIFHWGEGVKKINAAKIDKEIKELELKKNQQLLRLETEQARLNLQLAGERVNMNKSALEQASENLRVALDNYEIGMETITDLLIARTQWQNAHNELIDSKTNYKIKETEWLKVTGRLKI